MSALTGIRVIELASERCAFAGKLLADMGADVILVEPPGGDTSRSYPLFSRTSQGPTAASTGGTTTRASGASSSISSGRRRKPPSADSPRRRTCWSSRSRSGGSSASISTIHSSRRADPS
ncbi:MAG: CoA transferase [Deltaproteobacteria bacterium]|nr:CoA transferase [Deltaproteobacteria bacterium]